MEDLHLRVAVKRELRKRMRGVRATLPAATVASWSALVAGRLATLPSFSGARLVAFFWPIEGRNEVDLRPLIEQARARGQRVAFPATAADGAEICLRELLPGASLAPGPLGFDEPPADAPLADPVDLVVVPALAVDPRGHRIGYGRGYYDRLLARMAGVASVAVAFDFQLVIEVPATEGDVPVGEVVTDRRSFRAGDDPGLLSTAPPAPAPAPEPGVKVIPRPARG